MLLTKFGQNPIMNVEGAANRQKEEQDMTVPFARARPKLGESIH